VKVTGVDHIGIHGCRSRCRTALYTETRGLTAGPIEARDQPPIRRCCLRIGDTGSS
jgi:hypothetical protein